MSVQRYRATVATLTATAYCAEHPEGEYVKAADYDALRAELEEAKRDAARYRWLRDVRDYAVICKYAGNLFLRMPAELDAAIDAAMEDGK